MLYSSFPICQSSTKWVPIIKDQDIETRSLDKDLHLPNLLKIGKIIHLEETTHPLHQEETTHLHHQEKKSKAIMEGIQDPMVKETVDISIVMDIENMKMKMKKVDVTVDVTIEKGAITKERTTMAIRVNVITIKIKKDID